MQKNRYICTYNFPRIKNSKIIRGYHRVVSINDRITPYGTKLVAPITSAKSLKDRGSIPSNYLELKKEDYPFVLDNDSYVNLDMIMAVDKDKLEPLYRNGCEVNSELNSRDKSKLDRRVAETFELEDFVIKEVEKETKEEMKNFVEYLETEVRYKLEEILTTISDNDTKEKLRNLLDNTMINELKENYLC